MSVTLVALMIHIRRRTTFHEILSIFKFEKEGYTLKDRAGQTWLILIT